MHIVCYRYTKLVKEEKTILKANSNVDAKVLAAGDTIAIKPQIFDQFGNVAVLPEGALKVTHERPDGGHEPVAFATQSRGGVQTYDIRYDCTANGNHVIFITIDGDMIKGAPLRFYVNPDKPDPPRCVVTPPSGGPILVNQTRQAVLKTYDRFGNACDVGGLNVTCRPQLIKQGAHDQAALVPGNHKIEIEDVGDGSYLVNISFQIVCLVKLFVNLDKNLPTNTAELPPITLHVVDDGSAAVESPATPATPATPSPMRKSAWAAAAAVVSGSDSFRTRASSGEIAAVVPPTDSSSGGSTPKSGLGSARLRGAVTEVMQGFGAADDRRRKSLDAIAVEAFTNNRPSGSRSDSPSASIGPDVVSEPPTPTGTLMKSVIDEITDGLGSADERRPKDAALVALEGFADGAESFSFDKAGGEGSRRGLAHATSAPPKGESTPNSKLFSK